MGKWCPDVVRLQGAVDMRRLGLVPDDSGRSATAARTSKFRKVAGLSRRDALVEEMLRSSGVEGDIHPDDISDPDVLAAYRAAIETGLIPSDDRMGGI